MNSESPAAKWSFFSWSFSKSKRPQLTDIFVFVQIYVCINCLTTHPIYQVVVFEKQKKYPNDTIILSEINKDGCVIYWWRHKAVQWNIKYKNAFSEMKNKIQVEKFVKENWCFPPYISLIQMVFLLLGSICFGVFFMSNSV